MLMCKIVKDNVSKLTQLCTSFFTNVFTDLLTCPGAEVTQSLQVFKGHYRPEFKLMRCHKTRQKVATEETVCGGVSMWVVDVWV